MPKSKLAVALCILTMAFANAQPAAAQYISPRPIIVPPPVANTYYSGVSYSYYQTGRDYSYYSTAPGAQQTTYYPETTYTSSPAFAPYGTYWSSPVWFGNSLYGWSSPVWFANGLYGWSGPVWFGSGLNGWSSPVWFGGGRLYGLHWGWGNPRVP